MPSKRLIRDNTDKLFLQRRCRGLEQYCNEFCKFPNVLAHPIFLNFVERRDSPHSSTTEVRRTTVVNFNVEDEDGEEDEDEEVEDEQSQETVGTKPSDPENWKQALVVSDYSSEDLSLKNGEHVAFLGIQKEDEWMFVYKKDGSRGYVPKTCLNMIDGDDDKLIHDHS